MGKRITISDLANELGLSKTLVSMVLNGKGDQYNINVDTQKRVIELAKKLNYRPNQNARSLRTGRSNSIGFIIPDISNAFYARIARVLESELEKFDQRLLICSSDEDPEREKELVDFLMSRNTDGLIVASCLKQSWFYVSAIEGGFPVVLIDRKFYDNAKIPSVSVGNQEAAFEAVDKMINSGKKNIYMLTLTPEYISSLRDRRNGFTEALKKHGIEDKGKIIEVSHSNTSAELMQKVGKLLESDKPDGFFVSNNLLTVDLLKYLRERNMEIPGEVAVISFDDIPLFNFITPSITAIAQPVEDIAKEVARMIMKQINNNNVELVEENIVLGTTLVNRNSV